MKRQAFKSNFIKGEDYGGNPAIANATHIINNCLKAINQNLQVYYVAIKCEISNPIGENGYFVFIKDSDEEGETEMDGSGVKLNTINIPAQSE